MKPSNARWTPHEPDGQAVCIMQNLLSQLSRGGLRKLHLQCRGRRAGWRTEARPWGGSTVCCQRRSPKRFWAGGRRRTDWIRHGLGELAKNLEAEGLQNEMTHIHDEHCRRTVGILSLLCLIPSPASFRESSFARRNISDDAVTVAWIASSLCYLMTVAHGTHKSASCISSAEFV
jgi:hypothetical protein